MKKKLLTMLVAASLCAGACGCSKGDGLLGKEMAALPHFNGVSEDGSYDSKYFYRNDLDVFGGDVDVEWVPEGRVGGGYFYMYTSGNDGVGMQWEPDESKSAITVLRSKDLNDWELCGNVANGFSCTIAADEWLVGQIWAPEVIYNPADETYYLYTTGMSPAYKDKDGYRDFWDVEKSESSSLKQFDRFFGAVFMSKDPCGPFYLATSERYYKDATKPNENGRVIGSMTPTIDIKRECPGLNEDDDLFEAGDGKNKLFGFIDMNPFYDDNGDLYVYFVRHPTTGWSGQQTWGVKMKDMITPDWSTLTLLLASGGEIVEYKGAADPAGAEEGRYPRYKESSYTYKGTTKGDGDGTPHLSNTTVTVGENKLTYKAPGEGCHMVKHGNRYYLTATPGGFGGRQYVAVQSIGESPLGPFERLPYGPGCVVGVNETNDYMTGIGHTAYVEKDWEMFSIHFAHADPFDGNSAAEDGRIYCFDRVTYIEDPVWGTLMYGNGPTQSLQPKVISECGGGMKNIAGEATITATNAQKETLQYLNDGRFVCLEYYKDQEFVAKGKTTITLEFAEPREIGAILIYNSFDYDYAFSSVDMVQFSVAERPAFCSGDVDGVYIKNLPFNTDYVNTDDKFMRVGGAAVASFDPIKVSKIRITLSQKFKTVEEAIKVSEIAVLGK